MPTFRLNSLMLVVTLIALCLGANYWASPVGYVLLAIGVPAGVRTLIVLGNRIHSGDQPTTIADLGRRRSCDRDRLFGRGISENVARSGTFSLAWLLGLVSVAAVWFGLMTYSWGLGIAIGIVALQIYLRVRWHRFTSWKLGWNFGVGPLLTTALFSMSCMSGISSVVYMMTKLGIVQMMQAGFIDGELGQASFEIVPVVLAWISGFLMFESFIVFSLRNHPDPI